MQIQKSNNELLLSSTQIPDIFIVQYMQVLSGDAIKLYLWLNQNISGEEFTLKELDTYTFLTKNKKENALAELISNELVYKTNDKYCLTDLIVKEAKEYAKSYAARGNNLDGTALMSDENERKLLSQSISNTFYLGKMLYWGYKLVDKCLYEYKMESEVIYKLFEEGVNLGIHVYANKMQGMAEKWYNNGYVTADKLDVYYANNSRIQAIIELIGRITRRRVDGLAIDRITKWVEVYNADADLVEYAFVQNEYRGANILNAEETLNKWFEAGIHSIDKAMVYEAERHQENKAKQSRKKGTDNVWKSGAEAGIVTNTAKPAENTEDAGDIDNILGMFGE